MTYFESLIHEAVRRSQAALSVSEVARAIGLLYEDACTGGQIEEALHDPFFPFTLYAKHHLPVGDRGRSGVGRAAQDLALLGRMFLRIRRDIDRCFGNREVTWVDLNGDAGQEVAGAQWCSLCGACCQLPGTVSDPPETIRYAGNFPSCQ